MYYEYFSFLFFFLILFNLHNIAKKLYIYIYSRVDKKKIVGEILDENSRFELFDYLEIQISVTSKHGFVMRDESLHARTQLTSCVVKINENPVFNENFMRL